MVRSMDNIGIEKACVAPHMCLSSDITAGNDEMLAATASHPDRLLGYFTSNPHYPDLMESELHRCFENSNVAGIKIHQGSHQSTIMDPGYRHAYEFADKRGLPVLIHTWLSRTISNIEAISAEYPRAVFIMGHFGASNENMLQAAGVVKSRKNVYGDTTLSTMREGNIEWLVELAGEDKLLFGTDMPFMDPRPCLGRILKADISEKAREKILGGNFLEILQRASV
jgi:hypothetical protein